MKLRLTVNWARLVALAAGAAAFIISIMAPAHAETRVALVIGNGAYRAVTALDNPANDAHDVGDALKALGFAVEVVIDADFLRMRSAAANFATRAEKADVALVYYAGHGLQIAQRNFLVPVDASFSGPEDVERKTFRLDELLQALGKSKGQKLIFLDACRNNPFGSTTIAGAGKGLAEIGESAGLFIAFATKPNDVALDGAGRNSPFAQAFLNHVAAPGVDISSFMIEVRRDVAAASGGAQIPWDSSSLTRQFFFADASVGAMTPEAALWAAAARDRDVDLLAIYLDRYPKGPHANDASALISEAPGKATSHSAFVTEDELWRLALSSRQRPVVDLYLARFPAGAHVPDARSLASSLKASETAASSDPETICERLATAPADGVPNAPGVDIVGLRSHLDRALEACQTATTRKPENAHYQTLLARTYFAAGRFDEAVALYKSAAAAGDGRAMVTLGLFMEFGDHAPKDPQGALALYEKAADRGNADGAINLGFALAKGLYTEKDLPRAFALFKKASEAGSSRATFDLATLVEKGLGGDPGDALALYRRAAGQGEPAAHRAAAKLLEKGRDTAPDFEGAAVELLACVGADGGQCLEDLTGKAQPFAPDTIRALQTRLRAARYYAGAINGRSGPELAPALKQWRLLGPPEHLN